MTSKEQKIIDALKSLGGKGTSVEIWRRLVELSFWGNTTIGHIFVRLPWETLLRLERDGKIKSDWATPKSPGAPRLRVYMLPEADPQFEFPLTDLLKG